MVSINLSYFDTHEGPKSLLSIPAIDSCIEDRVVSFLDSVHKECWSEFTAENLYSNSYYFEINSPIARGKKEMLLLSILLDKNERFEIPKDLVLDTVDWIKNEAKIYFAFHSKKSKHHDPAEYSAAIRKLEVKLGDLLDSINKAIRESKSGSVIIFGLDKAGKTTLINSFKEHVFSPAAKPTLGFQILKLAIGNLDLKIIDAPGQKNLRDRWWNFQNNINGIIFVVDISDPPQRKQEAKKIFEEMLQRLYSSEKEIPLLIIANKADMLALDVDRKTVLKHFKEDFAPNEKVIIFHHEIMSAKSGEGIQRGFRWLFGELVKV